MHMFGAVPVSVMVVANGLRNAPLLCCWHTEKLSPRAAQWASEVQGSGGFANASWMVLSKQKPQKTRACVDV